MDLPYLTTKQLTVELNSRNLLSARVEKAITQALESHRGQIRMSGASYVNQHVFPVAADISVSLPAAYDLELAVTLALLHDTIEDDETFTPQRCAAVFGEEVTELILFLTKQRRPKIILDAKKDKLARNKEMLDRLVTAPAIVKWIKIHISAK